jgi:hypothetical protein
VARQCAVLRPYLDERQRRLVLAAETAELGRGGIKVVAQATGVHPQHSGQGGSGARIGGDKPDDAYLTTPRTNKLAA